MSEWTQRFDPPGQKRDCVHGRLARSCVMCENEHAIFELSRALKDCIQLFIDADNAPDHKSLICTGDRREMWEEVLKKYGQ